MSAARPQHRRALVPWYKRSMLAPVWVTLVLALVFGGVLLLMSFDIQDEAASGAIAQHDQ